MLGGRQTQQNEIGALKSSAEKGDARAQNSFGHGVSKRAGVPQDVVEAYSGIALLQDKATLMR